MPDAVTTAGGGTGEFTEKLRSVGFVGRHSSHSKTDDNGHTITEHKDGSVDVAINVVDPVRLSSQAHEG